MERIISAQEEGSIYCNSSYQEMSILTKVHWWWRYQEELCKQWSWLSGCYEEKALYCECRNSLPQGTWLCNDIDVIIWDIRKSWWWKKSISEWRQVILLWKRLHYYFKILNKFIIIFNIVMLSMLTIQVGFSQLYLKKLGRLSNMFFFISKKLILMVLQDTVKFYQQRYYIAFLIK